jgi:hypothetical protein
MPEIASGSWEAIRIRLALATRVFVPTLWLH